jgi:hypothetical protein
MSNNDNPPSINNFSAADLKKQMAISVGTHSPQLEVILCKSGRSVLVKPLKVREKKELLKALESKSEIIINKALDDILELYVIASDGEEFNPRDLSIQERYQLLVYIRAANGDKMTKIVHQCPKCEHVNKDIEFNIVQDLNVKVYEEPKNGKVVMLCNGKVEVHFDVIYRKDEVQAEEYIKKNKLKTMTDRLVVMVASSVRDVFFIGEKSNRQEVSFKDFKEKIDFIEDLGTSELNTLSAAINQLDFGVKMPFNFHCTNCDYEEKQEVGITVFFIS